MSIHTLAEQFTTLFDIPDSDSKVVVVSTEYCTNTAHKPIRINFRRNAMLADGIKVSPTLLVDDGFELTTLLKPSH